MILPTRRFLNSCFCSSLSILIRSLSPQTAYCGLRKKLWPIYRRNACVSTLTPATRCRSPMTKKPAMHSVCRGVISRGIIINSDKLPFKFMKEDRTDYLKNTTLQRKRKFNCQKAQFRRVVLQNRIRFRILNFGVERQLPRRNKASKA